MQEELLHVSQAEQIDERLRKNIRRIYERGGDLGEFFKRLPDHHAQDSDGIEVDPSPGDIPRRVKS